jgi:hypothetical protein
MRSALLYSLRFVSIVLTTACDSPRVIVPADLALDTNAIHLTCPHPLQTARA